MVTGGERHLCRHDSDEITRIFWLLAWPQAAHQARASQLPLEGDLAVRARRAPRRISRTGRAAPQRAGMPVDGGARLTRSQRSSR